MIISNCMICKHFKLEKTTGKSVCPAYPKGIPEDKEKEYDPKKKEKECANNTKFEPNC